MIFLNRKSPKERRRKQDRRRGANRRRNSARRRLRTGFRAAVLGSSYHRPGGAHKPLSKTEWLDTFIVGTTIESSRDVCWDANGRKVPWRDALEHAGELAWTQDQSRAGAEKRRYSAIERAARMTESAVDYLLAEYTITHLDRRINVDRRVARKTRAGAYLP